MRTEGCCNYKGDPLVQIFDNHDRTITIVTLADARALLADIQAAIEEAEGQALQWEMRAEAAQLFWE